jgi:hypothetical protein
MKTNTLKFILLLGILAPVIFTESCGPNLARTNARIENGFQVGGAVYYDQSIGQIKNQVGQHSYVQIETNVQYGRRREDNYGFAAQLKLGFATVPGVDIYLELPSSNNFYYGVGADLGFENIPYIVGTYYFNDVFFATFTGRYIIPGISINVDSGGYGSQLALGWNGKGDNPIISIFGGYDYFTGDGFTMEFNNHQNNGSIGSDNVGQMVYGGMSVQF